MGLDVMLRMRSMRSCDNVVGFDLQMSEMLTIVNFGSAC